jgi:hypothetical protein
MPSEKRPVFPQWLSAQDSIVDPATFSQPIEVEDAVLCFSDRVYSGLIRAFNLPSENTAPRLPGSLEGCLDKDVAIYLSCFGAPAAGMLMETLVASGVKRFVMLGQAGAISAQCEMGDLLLPTWGLREEGTSYHYLAPDVKCTVSEAVHERSVFGP